MIIRVFKPNKGTNSLKLCYRNENGQLHRIDGPAKIYHDGSEEWWQNGVLHRDGEPATIWINTNGITKRWFFNGLLHRVDGPAEEYSDGDKH